MKNFVQQGNALHYEVTEPKVKSGEIVIVEDVAGIAVSGGETGDIIALSVEGVYRLPKGTGAIKQGEKVYVNVTAGVKTIVTTATDNTFIGYAWDTAGAADETVNVKLSF